MTNVINVDVLSKVSSLKTAPHKVVYSSENHVSGLLVDRVGLATFNTNKGTEP